MRPRPILLLSFGTAVSDLSRWSEEAEAEIAALRAKLEAAERVVEAARAFGVLAAQAGEWTPPWEEAWIALSTALAALDALEEEDA